MVVAIAALKCAHAATVPVNRNQIHPNDYCLCGMHVHYCQCHTGTNPMDATKSYEPPATQAGAPLDIR